jgi:hypothetical protein
MDHSLMSGYWMSDDFCRLDFVPILVDDRRPRD